MQPEHGAWVLIVVDERYVVIGVDTQVLPGCHVSQANLLLPSQYFPYRENGIEIMTSVLLDK